MNMLAMGMIWYVVFLFSTTLHEAAHAWAAMRMGDLTAYLGGQVSLHPGPHIQRERVGMVIVPILSFLANGGGLMFGWASAPYNPNWANRYPKRAALMAMAGPGANLLLSISSALLVRVGLLMGLLIPPQGSGGFDDMVLAAPSLGAVGTAIAAGLSIAMFLNAILFILNMLPVPPLDGNAALTLFMSHEGALRFRMAMGGGGFAIIGLIAISYVFGAINAPLHRFLLNLVYYGYASYGYG